jgi:hypothetical protein
MLVWYTDWPAVPSITGNRGATPCFIVCIKRREVDTPVVDGWLYCMPFRMIMTLLKISRKSSLLPVLPANGFSHSDWIIPFYLLIREI